MSLFVFDTAGDKELRLSQAVQKLMGPEVKHENLLDEKPQIRLSQGTLTKSHENSYDDKSDSEDDGDYFGLPPPNVDVSKLIAKTLEQTTKRQTKVEKELERVTELVDAAVRNAKQYPEPKKRSITQIDYSDFNPITGKLDEENFVKTDVARELSAPGIEQIKDLARPTHKRKVNLNRLERSKTKGPEWYNLPATEHTEEVLNDLKILQMRSVLDPKHFYKKNDLKVLPKYFQIGTVQHSPLDYYSERDTRKKKRTMVDELLTDTNAINYTKRKYQEVIQRKDIYARRKALKKMKKLKKNK